MQQAVAHGSVLRFGVFELDLKAGQVRKSGVRKKLRPQAFQVLTLLASRAGELVTREEIQKEIWTDGTFVDFEQGLNFCIRQIRALLGDDADSPRFIETIPRRGYRFLVPVRVKDPALAFSAEAQAEPPRAMVRGAKTWFWIGAAGVVFVVASVAWYFRPRSEPVVWRPVPLTSYPGFERNPALSPEGSQVAFTWNGEKQDNFDIYIKLIGSDRPLRLTVNPAEDVSPAWSPDGRTIAFLRRLGNHRNEILLIPALGGGSERKLAESRTDRDELSSLAWSPDGRWLAVSHRERESAAEGLFLVSVQTGEKRRVTEPPRGYRGDYMPAFSPDGHILAFSRLAGYSASEVYLLPLTEDFQPTGEVRRLTADNRWVVSPVWTRDGRHILYVLANTPGAQSELRMIAVSGSRTSRRVPPLEDDVSELDLGRHLVYSRGTADTNIWRAEIPPPSGPPSAPQLLISSTWRDDHVRYSPDGKKVAFVSDRSGSAEIWMAEADGSNPVQLTSFGGPMIGMTNWSPDSQKVIFHARPEGQADLFVIPVAGGVPKRLTTDPSDDTLPSYSRDARWIYFGSMRSGRLEIWRMPAEGGDPIQVTHAGGATMPVESPDGRTLYYAHSRRAMGIWRLHVQGGEAEQVTGPLTEQVAFAVTADGIFYSAAPDSQHQHSIRFLSFATGQTQPVVVTDRQIGQGLSLSPDHRLLVFAQLDRTGSDLMVIENFVAR